MNRRTRGRAAYLLATVLLAGAVPGRYALAGPAYPVQRSANHRYLVDQNGAPFLMMGDSPQALIVNISEADADMYFADRAAHGFNSVWINLLCDTYTGGRSDGSTYDGILPFTGTIPSTSSYDLGTPNETYFAHADRVLRLAAAHGLQVVLDPAETGGWLQAMLDNGVTRCRDYGRFLGARYRSYDNLLWMSGNDFQNWPDPNSDAVVRAVAYGILDNDTRHLQTTELNYLASSSLDDPTWVPILTLNGTYTYYPTYDRLEHDYNRSYFLPNFMVEANYEFESLQGPVTTAPILRKQEYWTMTSGATGQIYGNGYVWPFRDGWQENLDTPGAAEVEHLVDFFRPRAWYNLVPDTSHTVVTSGYGVYSGSGYVADNDYLTAARAADGSLAVVYTPILRTFTVDMSRLGGPANTRWFDPANGTYRLVAGSPLPNAGSRNFTPPGLNGDGDGGWVLVLETGSMDTQPPVVALTSPGGGSTVADSVQVSAIATDNVAVEGVQFQVDGTNLGWEVMSPPYSVLWNTRTAPNGPHVVKAIAFDEAGNRAADSVSVVVDNPVPPPPTDHLAVAYAFDETGGLTTADASGNGNTGTLHGADFAPGKNSNGVAFNGVNAYVETPNSHSLDIGGTGITIAFWVFIQPQAGGTDYVIAGKPWNPTTMVSPFYQYGVEYSNSGNKTLDFYFGDSAGNLHGPFRMSPTTGVWTHAAYTYDGSTVTGYLNGSLELSAADHGSLEPRGNSLRLGVDGAYQQFFDGKLDDFRIYSRALTLAEIESVMQTPVGGGETAVPPGAGASPASLALTLDSANPFARDTRFTFLLPRAGEVSLQVYDASGRHLRTLERGVMPAGAHQAAWNGADGAGHPVPSGHYYLRLASGGAEKNVSVVRVR